MRHLSKVSRISLLALILIVPFLNGGCGCGSPVKTPAEYSTIVSTFTIGTLALDTMDPTHTQTYLTKMTAIAPEEPAGWANLGLFQLRGNQLAEANASLNKARDLAAAPNAGIEKLLAILTDRSGDLPGTIQHLQKAVQLAPEDLQARYSLAKQFERDSTPAGDAAYQAAIQGILERQPYNLVALANLARIAAKRSDAETLTKTLALLEERSRTFNPQARARLQEVKALAARGDAAGVRLNTQFMANQLKEDSAFNQSSHALERDSQDGIGDPIRQFIKLPPMPAIPAAPDTAITFAAAPLIDVGNAAKVGYAGQFYRDSTGAQTVIVADGHTVRFDKGAPLAFPGGPRALPPGPNGILAIDTNYDLKSDLVFAGAGGLKLYQQTAQGMFADVTSRSKLDASTLGAAYSGAWAADIEADGDLDVVLGSEKGLPTVLRNNSDGTWTAIHPFAGISGLRDFAWADLDADGSIDAAFIDGSGKLHVFANQRAGLFRERPLPSNVGKTVALAVADVNSDGKMDLLALQADGAILRISDKLQGKDWDIAEVAHWAQPPHDLAAGTARLMVGDLDNNGGLDLIASTPTAAQVWLCNEKNGYAPLPTPISGSAFTIADIDGKGRLDLIGVSAQGQPVRYVNKGVKNYSWQEVRPRAADEEIHKAEEKAKDVSQGIPPKTGDHRSNSFGIGGEVEIRAGLLYQKQSITSPVVHIGLGTYPEADAARVIWPNGDVRSEFSHLSVPPLVPNSSFLMKHRLKGSCPWVFAWNGKEMGFVTDFLWRSPVGLRINAQDTAGIAQTEDWVKIRGDQLVPRDGYYDVRITAELWETHFFDYVRLMTVDHPAGTEIFVDERFAIPPPKLVVHTMTPPKPVARAVDDNGTDVTDIVRARDGRYLDTFGRGDYQGITRDHYVEVEIPADTPRTGPLYLVASGWIHPTDSSINVAISQGTHDPPRSLSLEIPDGKGGWRTAKPNLGFPAGKTKTILIRLDDIANLSADASKSKIENRKSKIHLRLRTNLEIYWDSLAYATEVPHADLKTQRLPLQTAELRYRGYSTINQANDSSPELPDYEHPDGTGQRWRDLIGYCTRFGDVRELLDSVDDRYVIMNAGDEMALRFQAPPPPPAGWQRDFVLIGDGWEKDGDLNTAYSKTILPLPFHGQKSYSTPPGRLEDDPVVRRHPKDWKNFHTRYITPEAFKTALRPGK